MIASYSEAAVSTGNNCYQKYYLMITNIPTSTRTKVCAQTNGVQRALFTQDKKWSTTGWAQETFKTDQSMEATSTTAKKTLIKPSPSLCHTHKRRQALLPLGMLAVIKKTRHLTCFQNEAAKLQALAFLHMPPFLTAVTRATGAWRTSYGRQGSLPTKVLPFLNTSF